MAPLGQLLQSVWAKVPGVDSNVDTVAFKLQLSSPVLAVTAVLCSSSLSVPWKWYSLSLLAFYQNSLGQRLGHKPSGMGQSLVLVRDNALILESGIPLVYQPLVLKPTSPTPFILPLGSVLSQESSFSCKQCPVGLPCYLFFQTCLEMSGS